MKMICGNCMDFSKEKQVCTIRFTIKNDKKRISMKRKAHQRGCDVFLVK